MFFTMSRLVYEYFLSIARKEPSLEEEEFIITLLLSYKACTQSVRAHRYAVIHCAERLINIPLKGLKRRFSCRRWFTGIFYQEGKEELSMKWNL